jgi:hypothetical protein
MSVRRRTLAAAATVGVLIAVGAAGRAEAAGSGLTLGAGDSRCTDKVQSDNGARAVAQLTYGTGQWTVRRAGTAGGPETVVFRAPAGSLTGGIERIDRTIAPTAAGTFLYRLCLDVDRVVRLNGPLSSANYNLSISSSSPAAVADIGPDTATLSKSTQACGDVTAVPGHTVRLVGSASAPTRWTLVVTDNTVLFEGNWSVLMLDATSVDKTLVLDPEILSVTACANNLTNSGRVSVSFELSS